MLARRAKVFALIISLITTTNVLGQTVDQFNSWWYYFGTYHINDKWNGNLLYSWSRHDFIQDWQISKLGLSTNRKLTQNLSIGASYEWAIVFPYGELPVPEKRREHRFLERISVRDKFQKITISSVLEIEQYFSNKDFLHRVRARFGFRFPLVMNDKGEQKLGMTFFEQVFIDVGDGSPCIGQNRYYGGFDLGVARNATLAVGYLN
ncbi:MAG: DUF2490 domain-containing protein [Bacteroidota bacterium]